jgi:hypothetical protein
MFFAQNIKRVAGFLNLAVGVPSYALAGIGLHVASSMPNRSWFRAVSIRAPSPEAKMSKEKPTKKLFSNQLNQQYTLSTRFKCSVASLIRRLSDLSLAPEQIEILAGKVQDTYERQVLVETCREESKKSLQKIQGAINAYSNALSLINQRLSQAETTLENVLKTAPPISNTTSEKGIRPFDREKAKVLMAFASMTSKNSRIN